MSKSRELRVGVLVGLSCGVLITVVAYIWQGDWTLGFVIGSSLFFTLINGILSGTIIPLILYRIIMDPAVASGPLITTINDILSCVIYFGIATYFLEHIGFMGIEIEKARLKPLNLLVMRFLRN